MYAERMLTLTTFSKRKNTHGNEDRLHVYSLREVNPISGTAYFLSISECNFWCVFYFPVTWLFGVLRVNNKSDIDDSRSFLRHLILNLVCWWTILETNKHHQKRGYIVGAQADFVLTIQIIPCIIAFTFDYTIPLNSATTSHLHSLHNPPDLKCLSVKWEGACLSPFQIGASKLETIKLTLGLSGDCLCNN